MKRAAALFLCAVTVAGLMAGCGNKSADGKTTANDQSGKAKGDTFTIGFDASFPPYGYKDEKTGEYVGFDMDLAEEVCARNGWKLAKQPINWDAKDMELNSGTIDCIWNGFTINGREDKYTWTIPYVDNSQVVVVPASSGVQTLADLKGKNVEVQADSSALHALEGDQKELADTFAVLDQVPDYNTAFMDLEAGATDAIALDVGVAAFQVSSRGDKFVILNEAISKEQYGVGFKKGNDALKDQVESALKDMAKDGKFMEIAEKWGVQDAVAIGK